MGKFWSIFLAFAVLLWLSNWEQIVLKMHDDPIEIVNPSGCDEFHIQKNYKQVVATINLVPNSKILFSTSSKYDQVWNQETPKINIGELCEDDVRCTKFENIKEVFRYRSEQCFKDLFILVIYPETNEDENDNTMSISADYVDIEPCYAVTFSVHETINTGIECGMKSDTECEQTVKCSLVTCKYKDPSDKLESVWLPRVTPLDERETMCGKVGLSLVSYGELPISEYSIWFVITIVTILLITWWFWASWYYNLRVYQNKPAPFKVPKFCPVCCFPQPKETNDYSYDNDDPNMSNSFDVLDANQIRGATNRGTTKYRAPQFYFDDDD